MSDPTRTERRLWALAAACALLIYASVFFVRPVAEFLRGNNLLRVAVALSFLVAGTALLTLRLRNGRPGWRELSALGLSFLLLLMMFRSVRIPEERLHLLEYGVLAGLIYAAATLRQKRLASWIPPSVLAILSSSLIGWGEEGLQWLAPERYYDLRDVQLNATSALLGVVILMALRWARTADASKT